MPKCQYCSRPAWYRDRTSGEFLCPGHSRIEVRGTLCSSRRPPALQVSAARKADEKVILMMWDRFWDDDEMDCFGSSFKATELPALLARDGERTVGILSYAVQREEGALNIVSLSVLPDYQGRGAAREMIAALEDEARRLGIGRLIVATSNDNPLALYAYQRLGFRITGIQVGVIEPDRPGEAHHGFAGIPVRDEIQLEKRL